jgi:hypothetical protein
MTDENARPFIGDLPAGVDRPPDAQLNVGGPAVNEFEIHLPGDETRNWLASNDRVAVTVIPNEGGDGEPSKKLNGEPAYIWKANHLRNVGTPLAYKDQWLVCELDGVFAHLKHEDDGRVRLILSTERIV